MKTSECIACIVRNVFGASAWLKHEDAWFSIEGIFLTRHYLKKMQLGTINEFRKRFRETSDFDIDSTHTRYIKKHYGSDGLEYFINRRGYVQYVKNHGQAELINVSKLQISLNVLSECDEIHGGYYDSKKSSRNCMVAKYYYCNELDHLLTYLISRCISKGVDSTDITMNGNFEEGLRLCRKEALTSPPKKTFEL